MITERKDMENVALAACVRKMAEAMLPRVAEEGQEFYDEAGLDALACFLNSSEGVEEFRDRWVEDTRFWRMPDGSVFCIVEFSQKVIPAYFGVHESYEVED